MHTNANKKSKRFEHVRRRVRACPGGSAFACSAAPAGGRWRSPVPRLLTRAPRPSGAPQLRVEKRKKAGTREKHLAKIATVAGPARTGKAARRVVRQDRRAAKEKLVRARGARRALLSTRAARAAAPARRGPGGAPRWRRVAEANPTSPGG